MRIQLLKTPNQKVQFVYEDLSFVLETCLFDGVLYASVSVEGENIVVSRRVVVGDELLPSEYMRRRYGSLVFRSKFNTPVVDYTSYNGAVYLDYTPPEGE